MKNREETEKRILAGVDRIVLDEGFASLGINRVARESGVSKVLIYRYFESMEGLIRAWALDRHYWKAQAREKEGPAGEDWRERGTSLLTGQLDRLYENPQLREIIRWHLSSPDPLSREILGGVEREGRKVMEELASGLETDQDMDALITLLVGGIYYISLIADKTDVFNGIPLNREEGRRRIREGVAYLCKLIFRGIG